MFNWSTWPYVQNSSHIPFISLVPLWLCSVRLLLTVTPLSLALFSENTLQSSRISPLFRIPSWIFVTSEGVPNSWAHYSGPQMGPPSSSAPSSPAPGLLVALWDHGLSPPPWLCPLILLFVILFFFILPGKIKLALWYPGPMLSPLCG